MRRTNCPMRLAVVPEYLPQHVKLEEDSLGSSLEVDHRMLGGHARENVSQFRGKKVRHHLPHRLWQLIAGGVAAGALGSLDGTDHRLLHLGLILARLLIFEVVVLLLWFLATPASSERVDQIHSHLGPHRDPDFAALAMFRESVRCCSRCFCHCYLSSPNFFAEQVHVRLIDHAIDRLNLFRMCHQRRHLMLDHLDLLFDLALALEQDSRHWKLPPVQPRERQEQRHQCVGHTHADEVFRDRSVAHDQCLRGVDAVGSVHFQGSIKLDVRHAVLLREDAIEDVEECLPVGHALVFQRLGNVDRLACRVRLAQQEDHPQPNHLEGRGIDHGLGVEAVGVRFLVSILGRESDG
mmetsp:Transcript_12525/g.30436  ORF Transcript_12525/g.30436 Transcript_12525/m.30436 type:complete len:351 (+) Transcript_12525:1171-2223(+)